jgi:hypothetical protein
MSDYSRKWRAFISSPILFCFYFFNGVSVVLKQYFMHLFMSSDENNLKKPFFCLTAHISGHRQNRHPSCRIRAACWSCVLRWRHRCVCPFEHKHVLENLRLIQIIISINFKGSLIHVSYYHLATVGGMRLT